MQSPKAVDFENPELNTFFNTLSPAIKERILSVPVSEQSALLSLVKEKKEEEIKQNQNDVLNDVPSEFQVEKIPETPKEETEEKETHGEEKTITLKEPL
jgi:septum formation inhibitor MinC